MLLVIHFDIVFVFALIVGDMVDDLLLAEVSGAMFSAGVVTLFAVHAAMDVLHCRSAAEGRV